MTHYTGGCQCGAVRFAVDMEIGTGVTCNCSRCQKLGSVLAFAPQSAFTLEKGEGAMTEYLFNKQVIRHQFCKTCGIEPFSYGTMPDGTRIVAVNLNTLDDFDPRSLKTTHYDGKSM